MAKLHSYYVTNAQTELKHIADEIQNEDQINNLIRKIKYIELEEENNEINEFEEDESEDENENESENENENETDQNSNISLTNYNDYFNFSDEEFRKAMEINIEVVIEQEPEIIHGDLDFDNNELLNNMLE